MPPRPGHVPGAAPGGSATAAPLARHRRRHTPRPRSAPRGAPAHAGRSKPCPRAGGRGGVSGCRNPWPRRGKLSERRGWVAPRLVATKHGRLSLRLRFPCLYLGAGGRRAHTQTHFSLRGGEPSPGGERRRWPAGWGRTGSNQGTHACIEQPAPGDGGATTPVTTTTGPPPGAGREGLESRGLRGERPAPGGWGGRAGTDDGPVTKSACGKALLKRDRCSQRLGCEGRGGLPSRHGTRGESQPTGVPRANWRGRAPEWRHPRTGWPWGVEEAPSEIMGHLWPQSLQSSLLESRYSERYIEKNITKTGKITTHVCIAPERVRGIYDRFWSLWFVCCAITAHH